MTTEPTVLGDRYRLDEIIGRGGMAEVWRARDTRLHRDVAIKRLRVDLATDPTFQARFRREAQSAAGLNHPNIVSVYDTGEAEDPHAHIQVPYIVMELVEGHTLKDILRDGRKILPERALEFVQGTLDALGYSHRAGIIHRDIKPANVMLTTDGVVKVMDFGIARAVADTSATMTQTAAVIGTAQYLSPEQARGETVDNRSDIYSAGCLLYELLAGRPPFIGDSPVSVAYQHVREAPVPPSDLDPEISPRMDAITLKALAKDPADRYEDAEEMRDDIARLLAGEEITAALPQEPVPFDTTPPTAVSQLTPPRPVIPVTTIAEDDEEEERRGVLPWVIGALALALVAALALGLWQVLRPGGGPEVAMVTVPRVKGLSEEAARSTIVNYKLKVGTVTYVNRDADTKGQVLSQTPEGQTTAVEGTSVNIVVNQGPKMAKIPGGLVGKPFAQVSAALKKAGFTVRQQADDPATEDMKFDKGDVSKLNPAEGAEVPAGQAVEVTVATGTSLVPDFTGKTKEAAESAAAEKGFRIAVTTVTTSEHTAGQVFEQTPKSGEALDRTTQITVKIAAAPTTEASTPQTTPSTEPPTQEPPSTLPRTTSVPTTTAPSPTRTTQPPSSPATSTPTTTPTPTTPSPSGDPSLPSESASA
ncbi:Stk1 family PASTA domain-containing Ser/Thr kinase [Aestuariimicrobium sp. p3-SID1156]|uniref:Stk1 family PASTA domain-containing Ser/Thr kinase n=1 Tax=Aestuariimicrobium sp. p3-SID1156 TaxID=2916038 RepID=UPI00223BF90D|nr:Stk1 family PASTA domain-containing Ser/Thr kinase [Aestuariimicrobium sp. p3-SID1156]MCT1458540.1 Stk1 family PASTA domain-containing Ser/Thr kinase [Aestuariimicrobium sp. p3-SID1156]